MNIIIIDAESRERRFSQKRAQNTQTRNKEMAELRLRKITRLAQDLVNIVTLILTIPCKKSSQHLISVAKCITSSQLISVLPLPQVQIDSFATQGNG